MCKRNKALLRCYMEFTVTEEKKLTTSFGDELYFGDDIDYMKWLKDLLTKIYSEND